MSSTQQDHLERAGDINTDSIRALFNDAVARDGRTLPAIAAETGVPYGTLHPWAKAIYKGNNDRVAKQIDAWLTTREAREKLRISIRAEPAFVMTPTASRIWEMLERAQTMPDMVMISMGAGVGKTTAINAYAARGSNVFIVTAEPCHESVNSLLDVLSDTLKVDWHYRGSAMSRAIRKRLTGTGGLLIVDEAQHLKPRLRDQLRATVHDKAGAGIGVALVGGEDMNVQFQRERQDPRYAQLTRRIGLKLERAKPLRKDVEMLLDAWGVDQTAARELATGIAMKPGALGQMSKTLRLAFEQSDARGDETPTGEDIKSIWTQLGGNA